MITIYVQYIGENPWHKLMSGFNSIHEAMTWFISTYEHNADLWKQIRSVRVN